MMEAIRYRSLQKAKLKLLLHNSLSRPEI